MAELSSAEELEALFHVQFEPRLGHSLSEVSGQALEVKFGWQSEIEGLGITVTGLKSLSLSFI